MKAICPIKTDLPAYWLTGLPNYRITELPNYRMSPVPLLDLTAQNSALETELSAAFKRVLHSGHFILGQEVASFESECAAYLGARHALGVSSVTDALILALMALDIGPGDEVLCPSFTFFATAGSVARVGATPVFVDCCPVCFNIDLEDAAAKVSPRTKAIIPVHLFGQSVEMAQVAELARAHGLRVIEDAAQAFGASYQGRKCGTLGDFGTYSFFPSKNLGGFGDAGLLVTQDEALAEKARILRVHGMEPKYYHRYVGGNFRIDALQAALLRVKLPHLDSYCQNRRANAQYYLEALSKFPGYAQPLADHCCQGVKGRKAHQHWIEKNQVRVILPAATREAASNNPPGSHIWNQFTLRITGGQRETVKQQLMKSGVASEIYYPVPLHRQECFPAKNKEAACPVSERLAEEVLSLPVYPELEEEKLSWVVQALRA